MKRTILFIVSLLFGLLFINSGLNKFFNYMPMPDMPEKTKALFGAMMQISWLLPLIAVAEIIGGILIIIPKTRALGAIILVPITIGILLWHMDVGDSMVLPLILTAILLWIIFENRTKYTPMVQ